MRLRLSLIRAAFSRNPLAAAELVRFWSGPAWPYAPTFAAPVVLPVAVERGAGDVRMPDDGWEQRMSARAEVRKAARQDVMDADYAARTAQLDRLAMAYRAGMTLGDGVALLNAEPLACACIGPPHCCRYSFIQARALHRGAHLVAKLILSVVEKEAQD